MMAAQVSQPLPECEVCQAPMKRDRHAEQLGVCTRCIRLNANAFRAARIRVDAQHREAQRQASLNRQKAARRNKRRDHA